MRFLPENGKLKRVRVKKAEEGGSVERLKASLEKGKLLCGLGSSALCVACFGLRLFASNKEKPCLRYIRAQTLCGRARAFTNATNVCKYRGCVIKNT